VRPISVKIEPELLNKLDSYAEKNGLYRSDVIRNAIIEYLEKHMSDNEDKEIKIETIPQ